MLQTITAESFRERLARKIRNVMRRMAAWSHYFRAPIPAGMASEPHILTVTADVNFYSGVLTATQSCGWNAEWARSLKRAVEICRSRLTPIVIYDRNLPDVDWRRALDQLSGAAYDVRILLAAPDVDEDLWRMVLHRHGYDVLARSASAEQLERELRFAWLSLDESRHAPDEPRHGLLMRG
jgi:DNA-binding response OmpR family regulator